MKSKARNSDPRLRNGRTGKRFSPLDGLIRAKFQDQEEISLEKISLKLFSHSECSLMKAAQLVSGLLVWQRVHRINNGILRILVFACFNLWLKRMHDLHGDT